MSLSNIAEAFLGAATWGLVTAVIFRYGIPRFHYKDLPKPTILKAVILAIFLFAYFLAIDFRLMLAAIAAFPVYFISFYWFLKKFSK